MLNNEINAYLKQIQMVFFTDKSKTISITSDHDFAFSARPSSEITSTFFLENENDCRVFYFNCTH